MTGPAGDPGRAAADRLADPSQRPASSSTDAAADTVEFPRPPLDADRTVVMSAEPGFRVGWRGYDRVQVDTYRSRVETELASARSGHDGFDPELLRESEDLLARAGERLRLSAEHTVVVLAGGTGSGKSSLGSSPPARPSAKRHHEVAT